MSQTEYEIPPLVLRLTPAMREMSERDFFAFCQLNEYVRIERTAEGDLELMALVGGETSRRNAILTGELGRWATENGMGVGFASCTGFRLPNGAMRSPDVSWLRRGRWESLTKEERQEFAPLCPDFVAELRSGSDPLFMLHAKLEEYIANGAELGWLIDPEERKVMIYQPGQPVECLEDPQQVTGDPVLPGFVLEMRLIWGD